MLSRLSLQQCPITDQEAWGTIEENAAFVQHKIEEILAIEHCEKVNIIAHACKIPGKAVCWHDNSQDGSLRSSGRRNRTGRKSSGICGQDDLKREDYKGFDVIETYVDIVTDLKNMGF